MKHYIGFFLLASLFLFTACNDDPIEKDPEVNYLPMAVGNYWIYDKYEIRDDGTERLVSERSEKHEIIKEETIDGVTYYVMKTNERPDIIYLRESDGNIYTLENDRTYLSYSNFTDILYSTTIKRNLDPEEDDEKNNIYDIHYKMEPGKKIETDAGIFEETINKKTTYTVYPYYAREGYPNTRYLDEYYANNVGLILKQIGYISSPYFIYEYRLVEYYINEE